MSDPDRTQAELLEEVRALRGRLSRSEQAGAARRPSDGAGRPQPGIASVLDAVPDTFLTLDREWRVTYLNRHALREVGRPPEELLGHTLWGKHPSLGGPAAEAAYRKAMDRQAAIHFEISSSSGGRWLEVHVYPGPDGLTIHGRDITERKQAEEALRAGEELNRRVIEAVPGGVVQVTADGSVVQANAEAQRILGLSYRPLTRRFIADGPADTVRENGTGCPAEELPVSRCLKTGWPQPPVTLGVCRPDGPVAWAVYTAVPILDPVNGRPTGAVVTFLDITERKRAEQALRESEERHRLIAELTSDYSYSCRIGPDHAIRLESATEGFGRGTGYTVEQLEAQGGWATLIHPDDLPAAFGRMQRLLDGQRGIDELRIVTRGGETRWIRYMTQPIRDASGGRVDRFIGAVQDVTERKRAEAQLHEYAQRLQLLSRRLLEVHELERRHLARELHDEVAQTLTALNLALDISTGMQGEELRAHLGRAQGLVKDLTSRVRDLSLRLRPTMLDDLGLLPALVWHFRRYTTHTRVQVDFPHSGLDRRFRPEVETAAYRIVQEALTNVARHAGADKATVRVWLDRDLLCLQVEDRGAGFDSELVRGAGASNGLSGMQERAELLGGRLVVESVPGAGTCLTAELPVNAREEDGTDGRDIAAGG